MKTPGHHHVECLGQAHPRIDHRRLLVLAREAGRRLRQVSGEKDPQRFRRPPRGREEVDEDVPPARCQVCFLGELALGGDQGILTGDVEQAGRYLPQEGADRMAVLAQEQNLLGAALATHCDDRDRSGVAGVLTHNGRLPVDNDDMVLHDVDDSSAPHGVTRRNLARCLLVGNCESFLMGQETHVPPPVIRVHAPRPGRLPDSTGRVAGSTRRGRAHREASTCVRVSYFVQGTTDWAPLPTPKARAPEPPWARARAVSTAARVVPTESTVVTPVAEPRR